MQQVSNNLLGQATTVGKQLLSATDAAAAKTALGLSTVATSGAYADLSGKPALANVATSGAYSDLTGKPALATVATSGAYSDLTGKPALATVATSGSYNDLADKPATSSAFGAVYEFFEHFLSSASLAGNMTAGVTGGTNTSATITGNQFGVLQMSTNAVVATGQNARVTATANQVTFGDGEVFFAARIAQGSSAWFDGTTTVGAFRTGIFTSANADGNGVYFRAKTTSLEIVIRIAGVETAQTIGSLTLNQFVTLAFRVSANGQTVQAWVDGTLATTIATSLAGLKAFHQIHIHRENAVATNVIGLVDLLAMRYTPNTPFFTP